MKRLAISKLTVDCLGWRCGAIALKTHLLYYIFHEPLIIPPGLGYQMSDLGDKPMRKFVLDSGGVLPEVSQYCPTTID